MKSLYLSLIDYTLEQLKAIAEVRAVTVDALNLAEAAAQLTEALLAPASVAIVLSDLDSEEHAALLMLLNHGGAVELPRFVREYGPVRPMGQARLIREKPWRQPVNPAEKLWYKGLIFKGFQMTDQGSVEVIYIPSDLMPLLELSPPAPSTPPLPTLPIAPQDDPAVIRRGHLRETVFTVLVHLQTHVVRSQDELTSLVSSPAEVAFLLHVMETGKLITTAPGRLRPNRVPARQWLQAPPEAQLFQLQQAWRTSHTWNDLWHVPGLVPQPTGWENSPLRTRARILDKLAQLDRETWVTVADFVTYIKNSDPDFQRPNGDYQSWYIQDQDGTYLMGFENWDKVEGALLRYWLAQILPALDVVELGAPAEDASPTCFRVTTAGGAFLDGTAQPASTEAPAFLRANANFYVSVPKSASLYDRFQLARFAELDRREERQVIYRITQESVNRALRNGVTAEQITTFLNRATNNQTPLNVAETLLTWGGRYGTAKLEQVMVLRLADAGMADELKQHNNIGPLLGEQIGPVAFLIPAEHAAEIRRLLTDLGYLLY